MREETGRNLLTQHNLPQHLAESLVGQDGSVDEGKLAVALSGISWGKNPAPSAVPGMVQALTDVLHEAMGRRDMTAVMSLRSRLNKMGIPNP